MLPPLDVYTDEVAPPKWYHHPIKLVLELFCFMPGFPASVMGLMTGMSGDGNAFTRKYGVEIQRNRQIQPRTKIIYTCRAYQGRDVKFFEEVQRVPDRLFKGLSRQLLVLPWLPRWRRKSTK